MTEKEEEKMTLQIPYKYFLHILHAVPIYCPQNTNLQKVNRIVLLQFLFAVLNSCSEANNTSAITACYEYLRKTRRTIP